MLKKLLCATTLLLGSAFANAGTVEYSINALSSYGNSDSSNTYSGDGYVGMYSDSFGGLFGIEESSYSRTVMQVNIAALLGKTINSAYLSFDLLDGSSGSQNVTATSFSATGILGHFWDAPDVLGQANFQVNGLSSNSLNIKALLAAAVAGSQSWFGLHLQGSDVYQWTYANDGYSADRANVRLIVTFDEGDPTDVPAPASLAVLGLGLLLLRRARKTA